jgi:hypothetical protein
MDAVVSAASLVQPAVGPAPGGAECKGGAQFHLAPHAARRTPHAARTNSVPEIPQRPKTRTRQSSFSSCDHRL